MMEDGRLLAYADDLILIGKCEQDMKDYLQALEKLELVHNIKLNKEKSAILTKNKDALTKGEIEGVKVRSEVKYLGLRICTDRQELKEKTWATIKGSVLAFKRRFRQANDELAELVFNAYLRSVMRYYITPLVSAGMVTLEELKQKEMNLLREMTKVKLKTST